MENVSANQTLSVTLTLYVCLPSNTLNAILPAALMLTANMDMAALSVLVIQVLPVILMRAVEPKVRQLASPIVVALMPNVERMLMVLHACAHKVSLVMPMSDVMTLMNV